MTLENMATLGSANQLLDQGIESPLKALSTMDFRDCNLADYTHEILMEEIQAFEDTLDNDHEVAIKLASFGQSIQLAVTDIGYANPATIMFYGLVSGQPATLIQHVNQLSFLLIAVKRENPQTEKKKIGFAAPTED